MIRLIQNFTLALIEIVRNRGVNCVYPALKLTLRQAFFTSTIDVARCTIFSTALAFSSLWVIHVLVSC